MRTITLKNIHKSYGPTPALSGVSFTLAMGAKMAIVGENGAGKSTLLKILCGKLEPDEGELFGLDAGCVYIPQDFSGDEEQSPYDFLASRLPTSGVSKAISLLADCAFELGASQERLKGARCGDLSGGELKKLEMACGLATGSAFLALDEPENHLDYQTIEWLVRALSAYRGGLVFISHDQYLIDALADSIIELANGHLTVYSMTYDEYLDEKVRILTGAGRDWEIERKTLERLKKTVEMLKMKTRLSDSGVATYRQTKRRYEELKESHADAPPRTDPDKPKIRLSTVVQKGGKLLVEIKDLSFAYGTKKVFENANAELRFGEKVVVFGRNGSGKSTLLSLITGMLTPSSGTVRIGNDIRWQVMTQDHLKGIDDTQSALEVMHSRLDWDEVRCRSALRRYGLAPSVMDRPLWQLSGGQQARFKLALTFALAPEFLILDEPTNHVDPPTWEAIVEAIQGYDGTVLAITHDRAFIDAIAGKLWVLEDKKIRVALGTLSEYLHPYKSDIEPENDYRQYLTEK